jgi:hypothetical protein
MNYREMTQEQKDFCKAVVINNYNSTVRKCHTKGNVAKSVSAAFKSRYGIWPQVTASTVQTLLERARVENGMIVVPEPTGKGMICTWGRGKNETPALIDHVESICAAQRKTATRVSNIRNIYFMPFAVEMIPAAKLIPSQQQALMAPIEEANNNIADEIKATQKLAKIKYKTLQIPYYEDEDGNQIEIK